VHLTNHEKGHFKRDTGFIELLKTTSIGTCNTLIISSYCLLLCDDNENGIQASKHMNHITITYLRLPKAVHIQFLFLYYLFHLVPNITSGLDCKTVLFHALNTYNIIWK